jgi:hypothetical protein
VEEQISPLEERQHGPGSGGEGTPGRFVSRLLAERRSPGAAVHGDDLAAPSSAARLAPSIRPLQTSLFSSPVSANSREGASGAHAVKAPPAPETVLGLDRARYATGLKRLRPAGHRAMETQETTMEASPLASGQKGKARDILAAIHTLKQIEQEHRLASSEERQTLARFGGFGAVALGMFPKPGAQPEDAYPDNGWRKFGEILCLRVHSLNGPLLVRFFSIHLQPYTLEEKADDHASDPQRP